MTDFFDAQKPLKLFIIAGEPSGDLLGGMVLSALRQAMPPDALLLSGVGGEAMMASGLQTLFPMQDITAFGLAEVLPRIPSILRRVKQTARAIDDVDPDIILTIDAPDFCFRVIRQRKHNQAPVIHMVAPTVWAWRPKRAQKIARRVQHLLCLFPFEPPYFTRAGLAATAIGHPITASQAGNGNGPGFRQKHGLAPETPLLTVLLGSRISEISRLKDVFATTVRRLCARHPDLRLVVPTIHDRRTMVSEIIADWPGKPILIVDQQEKYDGFAASHAGLAASGTVSLELAMAGLPHIIAYRVHPLSAWIFRKLARTKYVNLINIMRQQAVVPECLQADCNPDYLVAHIEPLLKNGPEVAQQKNAFDKVMTDMGRGAAQSPAETAARIIISLAEQTKAVADNKHQTGNDRHPATNK